MKYLVLIIGCILAYACNPAKQLQRQSEALQKLMDAANNSRVIVPSDSIVYKPGPETISHDTTQLNRDSVKYFYYYTTRERHDTVERFKEDPQKLLQLQRENDQNKALYQAEKEKAANYLKLVYYIISGILLCLAIICFLKFR